MDIEAILKERSESKCELCGAVEGLGVYEVPPASVPGADGCLLDMLYLEDETLAWARATGEGETEGQALKYMDCNGVELAAGDTITVIKDLDVKGTSFTAKRGTAVRGISLAAGNHEQIEGRVNGQQIVILTKFVKKAKQDK